MKNKNVFKRVLAIFVTMLMVLSFACVAFASNISEEDALKNLTKGVQNEITSNKYTLEGGGSVSGGSIMSADSNGNYVIDETVYNSLTSASKTDFVQDIVNASNSQIGKAGTGVTEDTVQIWWKGLQQINGMGSKFMSVILANTKPDFVTANKIYQPFSGLVGTVLGLGAILIMALLGIVIVSDIAYIVLPPVRMFSENNSNGRGGGGLRSHLFSAAAINAVKEAENTGGGHGGSKQPLGIYFKHQVIQLIVLGICLLYLVQGQIYTLVGWVLDLVSGFLGF